MRKQPSNQTIKRLFASSGNQCSFTGCPTQIVHEESLALLAEICHINAASEGGPRYDPIQDDSERNEADNLILLCPTHHSLVDQDPARYPAEVLRIMKAEHESRVRVLMSAPSTPLPPRVAADLARQVAEQSTDFAIIVGLSRELDALRHRFPELHPVSHSASSARSYYAGTIATAHGGSYRLVATQLSRIGNLEAAHATADLLRDWNPRFLLVNGIAGGLARADQALGDIVVSESIVYYEPAKVLATGLEQRSRQFTSDRTLYDAAMNFRDDTWRQGLPSRPDGQPNTHGVPRVHLGPIASGDKVISAIEEVERLRTGQGNLIAVEMESAGVASAALSALKQVGFITIRSICDFADSSKNNLWQEYAASAATAYLRSFLESRPVPLSEGGWPGLTVDSDSTDASQLRARRKQLFDRLRSAYDMEDFKSFCFLLGVDVDELPGEKKSSRVRELILLFERKGQLSVLASAVDSIDLG